MLPRDPDRLKKTLVGGSPQRAPDQAEELF
ncbi:hypothetical protein HMPREF9458_01201 [Eggerthella lenta 1_1_60AFAA]|nr:hypothetical protein HMPREF9458_01201 [Eggerthella lenta 1_1_60AFAA]